MECKYCQSSCIKAGRSRNGTQRYRCNCCRKHQQQGYVYRARQSDVNESISCLLTEGIGIRGIARVLRISVTTVISRIKSIARMTNHRFQTAADNIFEIDELWTYIGKKSNEVWITYAFNRVTSEVVDFIVGPRTKERLSLITNTTLALQPSKICTDGLSVYRSLVPSHLHHVGLPHTRRIERFNLNLRTHLKRLTRKTICFSRSIDMLESCLKYISGEEYLLIIQ